MTYSDERRLERGFMDSFRSFSWFLIGAFVGGTYAYYSDSAQGRRRRKELTEKGVRFGRRAGVYAGKAGRDLMHRGRGFVAEAFSKNRYAPVDDETLRNRVRSEFGHVITHAGSVDVQVNEGEVVLSGPILSSEVEDLVHCVRNVPGVRYVINQLEVYQRPDEIPSLQGQGRSDRKNSYLQ